MRRRTDWARYADHLAGYVERASSAAARADAQAQLTAAPRWTIRWREGVTPAQRALLARSQISDTLLLRTSARALRRRAAGQSAPRRIPHTGIPAQTAPSWWVARVLECQAGIWHAIPAPGPELKLGPPDDPLVQGVGLAAHELGASLAGRRKLSLLHETLGPPHVLGTCGHVAPLTPHRDEDLIQQAVANANDVWERARAYGAAVVVLLHATAETTLNSPSNQQ